MDTLVNHRSVVVGVDGSRAALGAACWAGVVADRMHAPLLLVNATADNYFFYFGSQVAAAYPRFAEELRATAQTNLDRARDTVLEQHPSLTVFTEVYAGEPDHMLVELSTRAPLTVVGAHSHTAVNALLGSTTLRVVNHARGPVVAWRGSPDAPVLEGRRVLVGVDGEAMSGQVLAHGFEMASLLKAPLTAVHAWIDDEQLAAIRLSEALAGWPEKYPDVDVDRVIQDGGPATALLDRAETAQLIVVGSRVHNRILANLLGSTSQNVLHRATVPVLICRDRE